MKRRAFIKGAAVGSAGAALAAPAIVRGQQQFKWRLAAAFPKTLDTLFGATEIVAKRVSEATGGKFEIRVFAAGEIVPAFGVLDAVQQGTVEWAHSPLGVLLRQGRHLRARQRDPVRHEFAPDDCVDVRRRGHALLREFFREYNVVNFLCGNTGAQMAGWFRKEIKSLDDLKGLKMRLGGFGGTVFERIGVVPQNIPAGDIYPSLEKGTIDAAEFVGPYDDEKLGLYKIAKYYYYPAPWEGGSQISMYVTPKPGRACRRNIRRSSSRRAPSLTSITQAKYDARNPAALKRLVAGGAQLRALPRPVMEAAWKSANEVFAELSDKNPKWKKVYDSYSKFRDDEILWFRFAEGGFDSFMASIKR